MPSCAHAGADEDEIWRGAVDAPQDGLCRAHLFHLVDDVAVKGHSCRGEKSCDVCKALARRILLLVKSGGGLAFSRLLWRDGVSRRRGLASSDRSSRRLGASSKEAGSPPSWMCTRETLSDGWRSSERAHLTMAKDVSSTANKMDLAPLCCWLITVGARLLLCG